MIISCPECAGPFEVPDDRIAALVQVACPHCAFRMILDFAAANDPGLVEQGMRMASGFRSAADYHASVQGAAAPVEAEAVAVEATTDEPAYAAPTDDAEQAAPAEPEPEPVRARPEPVAQAEPPARVRREPARPAADARQVSEEARTEVHMLPRGAEKLVPVDIPPVRHRPPPRPDEEDIAVNVPAPATEIVRTVVGPPPTPPADEVAIDIDDEDEQETTSDLPPVRAPATAAERAAHPAFGDDEDEDVPTMVVTSDTREAARREMDAALAARRPRPEPEADKTPSGRERPRPPHTPPGRAKVRDGEADAQPPPLTPADKDERPVKRPAEETTLPPVEPLEDEDGPQERMSTFGVVVVVILVLLAGGLIGSSIALNEDHSPDPRPLLEKLYRQYVKGEPAAPANK